MPAQTSLVLIYGSQALLSLAGLWILWKRTLGAKAAGDAATQAAPVPPTLPALKPWSASNTDLGMLLWVVFCGGLFMQILGMGLLQWYEAGTALTQLLVGAMFQVGMLGACLAFTRFNEAGRQYDFPKAGFVREGVITFLCALGPVFAVGFLWNGLLGVLGVPADPQDLVGLFRNASNLPMLGFMIGLAILIAPLTEELIFRAGVFRFLFSRVPPRNALLLSSLLFGVIHVNLASFPQLTVLGLFFALSYQRTGNIAVPMLAHALFNLNTILLILAGVDS
jgi:membrane protease YdiL (CAAX protease family)